MATYAQLQIRPDTKKLVMNDCKLLFLRHNPQFIGMHLTEEFIVRRIANAYLDKL